ncbi:hypothetical protein ACFFWD_15085 [Bradyrhizobium erythrophlei]|uniref:hypothetical protein n=1 Tax=Bradyrhizobium erythrophlei TaxID=1437360 RepID=UPI0035F022D9
MVAPILGRVQYGRRAPGQPRPSSALIASARSRGNRRYVFRRKGHRRVAIKGKSGSQEFMDAYHALIEQTGGAPSTEIGKHKAKAGTVDAWMVAYYKHGQAHMGHVWRDLRQAASYRADRGELHRRPIQARRPTRSDCARDTLAATTEVHR